MLGVLGGFLLAALVLVIQNPIDFGGKGSAYISILEGFMGIGVLSSMCGSVAWSFIASEPHSRETKRFAAIMTSTTMATLLFTVPMLIFPTNPPTGFCVGVFGFGFFGWEYLVSQQSPEVSVDNDPDSNAVDGAEN